MMMTMKTDKCRSCGAKIIWTETPKGKRMPVDVEPTEGGNIDLALREHLPPLAVYHTIMPPASVKKYVSHFATCPESKKWRKR